MKLNKNCVSFIVVLLTLIYAGCGRTEVANNAKPPIKELFPAEAACVYPASAPGKVFSKLGGGTWAPTDPGDLKSSFECSGSNPVVQIYIDDRSSIQAEYAVTGVKDGATIISLTYRSPSGAVPNESTYRSTFANLADIISRNALKNPLPDLARRKLGNLKSYSQTGSDNTENFDVGPGFISVSRTMASDGTNISATVRFFSDAALKLEP